MKRMNGAAWLLLPLMAGCAGEGASTPSALPGTTVPLASQIGSGAAREAQSDAAAPVAALSAPSTADLLFVGNVGNNSITVYRHDAQGNTAPLRVISGSRTGISAPGQLSEDAQGNLYVANGTGALGSAGASATPAILVFAKGANGNVAPIRKLAGPLTGIHAVGAMTVDQSTGKVFVVDDAGPVGSGAYLLRFAPNPNGNEAPFARGPVSTWGIELASDSTGKNVIEAHIAQCCSTFTAGISTYAKQFANGAAPFWQYSIAALGASGVADDPTTKSYLATFSGDPALGIAGGIYRFAENTGGTGPDNGPGPFVFDVKPAIVSVISSDTCGGQLALGYLRNIYVTHMAQTGGAPLHCLADAVDVYAHDASGNVPPLRVLSGNATKLNGPYGIYEGQ